MGPKRFPFLKCPCVFSYDVAGEVIAVGSDVSRAKVGDRVLGLTVGPRFNDQGQLGAFQEYTLLADDMFSPILDRVSFEEACVIPLGLSTSASGMFEQDYLALPRPSVNPKLLGKTLLVCSGSSSVGCNAIQVGVAADRDIITTCSQRTMSLLRNWELVKPLTITVTQSSVTFFPTWKTKLSSELLQVCYIPFREE